MLRVLFAIIQVSWGFLQSLTGLIVFLRFIRSPHSIYNGVIHTYWSLRGGVSLGLFIFTEKPDDLLIGIKPANAETSAGRSGGPVLDAERPNINCSAPSDENASLDALLIRHEYGHTIQSLILGPLYLPIVGIPSLIWSVYYRRKCRRFPALQYYSFYTERWADRLGHIDRKNLRFR